ncbi:MAG: hypothetical protein PHQ01_04175, partial [Candidatus Pacebacteria bacterium]|nr:hypothetical protein [Candidatus Paceibacterota bacterium]
MKYVCKSKQLGVAPIVIVLMIIFLIAIGGVSYYFINEDNQKNNIEIEQEINQVLEESIMGNGDVESVELVESDKNIYTVAVFDNGASIDYFDYNDEKNRYDLIYKKDGVENIFWQGGNTWGDTYADSEL